MAADFWEGLRLATRARVGLGRSGDAMRLSDVLDFQMAHAVARDAVHTPLDVAALRADLAPLESVEVRSAAGDRGTYLRRPDLGRRLAPESRALLRRGGYDAVFVIGDGLSALAVQKHAAPVLHATLERLRGWRIAPVVVATQARVALGDEIGEALGATLCAMLIGERPGLSVAESLGVYLTYAPRTGCQDSGRNCISNIHGQGGLSHEGAAEKLAWLMREARQRKLSGIGLKDEAPAALPGG